MGCLTQREEGEKTTPWALGPSHPAAMTDVPLPLELENHTHLGLFSDQIAPPEIPEANRPENMGSSVIQICSPTWSLMDGGDGERGWSLRTKYKPPGGGAPGTGRG